MNDEQPSIWTWVHPKLAAWAEQDTAATKAEADEYDEYRAFLNGIYQLERERDAYHHEHETLPRTERAPHEQRVADMDRNISENYGYLRQRWPNPDALHQALAARRQQRVAEEGALHASIQRLRDIDRGLTDWDEWKQARAAHKKGLEAALARLEGELALAAIEVEDARLAWQEAADALGFKGQPTVDLPPRESGLKRALRYEPSLLVGINATERDAVRRDSFERSIT